MSSSTPESHENLSRLVWSIALILVIGALGIDLAPLIAGAGIAGVALGFGAQSLVKDCISGLFMLIEDQYGLGDVIDVGEAVGTVEEITLRATVLRDVNGTMKGWSWPVGGAGGLPPNAGTTLTITDAVVP